MEIGSLDAEQSVSQGDLLSSAGRWSAWTKSSSENGAPRLAGSSRIVVGSLKPSPPVADARQS